VFGELFALPLVGAQQESSMRRSARQIVPSCSVASIAVLGITAVALTAGGCQSTQLEGIRADPSPVEVSETERWDDIKNQMTVTSDTNLRLMWSDMGRLWLFDRPSRLAPAPMR